MSTTTASFENALAMLPEAAAPRRPRLLSTLRLIAEAMREGHLASYRYQQLTRGGGLAADRAVRQVFAEIYAGR